LDATTSTAVFTLSLTDYPAASITATYSVNIAFAALPVVVVPVVVVPVVVVPVVVVPVDPVVPVVNVVVPIDPVVDNDTYKGGEVDPVSGLTEA